ncbi:MAG: hypothetical protein ACFE85_14525 [Candidatus Hodarchaeota archaeon]
MLKNGLYLRFCKRFHKYKLPLIKFKEIDERYRFIYEKEYDISEKDINKASFIVFSLSFSSIFFISILFTEFTFFFIILYSFILSLISSYIFNIKLFKEIKKKEAEINTYLYFVKIYYSLIQTSLKKDSDYALNFIELIKDYEIEISKSFKDIIKKIQEGKIPEEILRKIITPSEDFNIYLNELILSNFNNIEINNESSDNTLERDFKIYLKQIESKLSIIFFIGLFYPLGLSFLLLFQRVDTLYTILLIPLLFFILDFLFKKLIKLDNYLIGLLNDYSKNERKRFSEFLLLMKSFALNLKQNLSPERSFVNSYSQCKTHIILLSKIIHKQVLRILNFTCSFEEMLDFLKAELKSIRYDLVIDVIKKIIKQDTYKSSIKIFKILEILAHHRKLEKKLELIIKGEKFKVLFFLFLLPVIIGAIGGMFPFFMLLFGELNNNIRIVLFFNFFLTKEMIFLFFSLLGCINLSSFYFLKIIKNEKRFLLILIVNIIYTLVFFMSFFTVINFF